MPLSPAQGRVYLTHPVFGTQPIWDDDVALRRIEEGTGYRLATKEEIANYLKSVTEGGGEAPLGDPHDYWEAQHSLRLYNTLKTRYQQWGAAFPSYVDFIRELGPPTNENFVRMETKYGDWLFKATDYYTHPVSTRQTSTGTRTSPSDYPRGLQEYVARQMRGQTTPSQYKPQGIPPATSPGGTTPTDSPTKLDNVWSQWLEETPEAQYYGVLQNLDMTPSQENYFRSRYGDIYNRYQGALGGAAAQGKAPTQTFGNWLKQNDYGNLYQSWWDLPSWQRGLDYGRFTPRTRWLNY